MPIHLTIKIDEPTRHPTKRSVKKRYLCNRACGTTLSKCADIDHLDKVTCVNCLKIIFYQLFRNEIYRKKILHIKEVLR